MNKNKKKILYVVLSLYPGGLENGIVNTINNFPDGYEHIVCCLMKIGPFAKRLKKCYKIIELNIAPGNDYLMPIKLYEIIKKEKIDLIRVFTEDPLFYGLIPAFCNRTPIIYYNGGRTFPEKRKKIIMERAFSNLCDAVVLPSRELSDYMNTVVGVNKKKTMVIANGVDIQKFDIKINKNKKKNELKIPKNDLVIGTIGRLERQKDYPTLIKIAKNVLNKKKEVTFIIVGEGSLKNDLKTLANNYGISNKIKFLGIREDVAEIYQIMDIFALTAKWEGMSNVMLEAMASKKMILSTSVEGVKGVIKNGYNGYLFNTEDINGFTKAILNYESDKSKIIGENAYKTVKEKFSIENMVSKYEELYLSLMR